MIATLLVKELRELTLGRTFWGLLLLTSVLTGLSFRQATLLYAEASRAALRAPELARGLSPFDGVLVPTFGALYLVSTLLWPFVAIRQLGNDTQSGALKLLVQTPAGLSATLAVKGAALALGFAAALAVPLSAVVLWVAMGGHVHGPELLGLVTGHALHALVVTGLSFAAVAWADSPPTAALVVLGATVGSWALDFLGARGGLAGALAQASLTTVLRPWEQGLFLGAEATRWVASALALFALAAVALRRPHRGARRAVATLAVLAMAAVAVTAAGALRASRDLTEARRNSFAPEQEAALARFGAELRIEVHLNPDDPRWEELERTILSRLRRAVPRLRVQLVAMSAGAFAPGEDERYGEVWYEYGGRREMSRSTSPREVLPVLWDLSGVRPGRVTERDHPGHPLVAHDRWSGVWFHGILPLAALAGATARWWRPGGGRRS